MNGLIKYLLLMMLVRGGWSLSEQEAIRMGLAQSPTIQIVLLDQQLDSLDYLNQSLTSRFEWQLTSDLISSFSSDSSLISSSGSSLSKVLYPGTRLLLNSSFNFIKSDAAPYGNFLSFKIEQPLLNKWGRGNPVFNAKNQAAITYRINNKKNLIAVAALISDIKRTYWEYYRNSKLVDLREWELDLADKILNINRTKYQIGEVTLLDTLESAIEFESVKDKLWESRQDQTQSWRELSQILGKSNEKMEQPRDSLTFLPAHNLNILIEKISNHNLEISQIRLQQQLYEARRYYYRQQLLPDLSMSLSADWEGNGKKPDESFENFKKSNDNFSLNLSYPLTRTSAYYAHRKNKLQQQQNKLQLRGKELELNYEITNLSDEYNYYLRKLKTAEKIILLAERRYDLAQEKFRLGSLSSLEELKARNDLINSKLKQIDTQLILKNLEIQIDILTSDVFEKYQIRIN